MTARSADWRSRLEQFVWGADERQRQPWRRRGLRLVRTVLVLARDLTRGQLTLRAMSLVYTTLLSIVPLLALSFSVLKAFGVHNQLQPLLLNLLEPLGERGADVANRIAGFIGNMNVGVLGALGLALLLYTAISLMQKIEESLNFIWHIPRPRRLGERFSRYLSVLMVGPILVFSALGVTASVMNMDAVRDVLSVQVVGGAFEVISRLTPYLLVIAAFTFVYLFIPNTQVRFTAALVGGAVGGIAWQTAGWLFAVFVSSSTRYTAIYSSFAILVLFMIWLYVSWLILLFGASVAFYAQHPEYLLRSAGEPRVSARVREQLALSAMTLVAARFLSGEGPPSHAQLAQALGTPGHVLQSVLDALEADALLLQSADDPARLLPARDPSTIDVAQVLQAVRRDGEARFAGPDTLPTPPAVRQVLERLHEATTSAVGGTTLRELAQPSVREAPGP